MSEFDSNPFADPVDVNPFQVSVGHCPCPGVCFQHLNLVYRNDMNAKICG